eukprot:COSAG02_NODE_3525_length_6615_cov_2.025629_7_plen_244_part_00
MRVRARRERAAGTDAPPRARRPRGRSDATRAEGGRARPIGRMADKRVAADTVAERLANDDTRASTLDAFEAMPPQLPRELALAAVPHLVDVASATRDRETFDRCTLLVARVMVDAAPNPSEVYGAAFGGGRRSLYGAARLIIEATHQLTPLTREDAHSFACLCTCEAPAMVRGCTAPEAAAGRTAAEHLEIVILLLHPLLCPQTCGACSHAVLCPRCSGRTMLCHRPKRCRRPMTCRNSCFCC